MFDKNLFAACLKRYCDCGTITIPSVRDLLASAMVQDPVTGCMSLAVTASPPPTTTTIPALNCDGTTTPVTVKDEPASQVVITGQTAPMVLCVTKEFDKTILCNKTTGAKVIFVTSYDPITGVPTTVQYNLDGTINTDLPADLVECEDADAESDRVKGCDAGVPVSKWVLKVNGVPTGTVYYTNDNTNAIVTPVAWTEGECAQPTPLNTHKTFSDRLIGAATYNTNSIVSGLRSISITRVSGTGTATITVNAGTTFELDFNREVFTDSASDHLNQGSDWVLGDYEITITGTVVVKWHGLL